MALTIHSIVIDLSLGTTALDAFLEGTEINSIESVTLVDRGTLLILYT